MKDINLFKTKDSIYLKEVSSKGQALQNLDCDGFLINCCDNEARKIIASLRDRKEKKIIAFMGGDDALNRHAVENLKINYLVSPEVKTGKDTLKQRDSGINHVVARFAAEGKIGIIINIGDIRKLNGKRRAVRIARIMQNIKICRKVGCKILIGSFGKNKSEVVYEKGRKGFGTTLGMSSMEVSSCSKL